MSTTSGRPIVRPTLQTVPESLPADHVTQSVQTPVVTAAPAPVAVVTADKVLTTATSNQSTPAASLKPRSTSSRVSSSFYFYYWASQEFGAVWSVIY